VLLDFLIKGESMFLKYKPTWMIEAIYQITPDQFKEQGIKAVFVDLDNTLIAWNNPDGTKELKQWLQTMKEAEIPVIVISNNSHARVQKALQSLQLDFISRALKPFPRGIHQALKKLDLKPTEVMMIGDQIMTDIKAANSAGVKSVLVKPIVTTDAWNTKFNRFMERKIMKHLLANNPEMKWQGELK
jgi:HAD superfamily phosphatase (TIGR01668 family)